VFQLKQNFLRIPGFPSMLVLSRQSDTVLRQLLNSAPLIQALHAFQLTERERLHIYRDGLVLYPQRDSTDKVLSAVEVAYRLTKQLPTATR
jgi:hypothetical protein